MPQAEVEVQGDKARSFTAEERDSLPGKEPAAALFTDIATVRLGTESRRTEQFAEASACPSQYSPPSGAGHGLNLPS